jgi:hypothetical protein
MEKEEMEQLMKMIKAILATQEKMLASMDAHQAKMQERMDANMKAMQENQETMARMEASMGSMKAALKSAIREIKFTREETIACQETMEARLEKGKPASVDMTPEVAHDQEVPVEDAEVTAVGEPKKRLWDRRNLAAVHHQRKQNRDLNARRRREEQEWAQRKSGCLKNSVAAHRGMTRRAVMALHRILFAETTRSRLIIAIRKVTRRAQVARHKFLSTEETSREFRGSRKGLVAAHRGTTRHAEVARQKEFAIGRNHTCDKIGQGTRRLRALRKGLWT